MNIIMSDLALATILFIPVVPADTELNRNGEVEELNSTDGHFSIINNQKLMTANWKSIFPVNKSYNFVHKRAVANGYVYVDFLNLMKRFRLPIRVIMTTDKEKHLIWNGLMSIENFSYNPDEVGDINYSISLKEFPETSVRFIQREIEIIKYIGNLANKSAREEALRKLGLLR